jgi:hypothetical protein
MENANLLCEGGPENSERIVYTVVHTIMTSPPGATFGMLRNVSSGTIAPTCRGARARVTIGGFYTVILRWR